MSDRIYTIGELSRLSGVPVRRLRFYSDQGLLPPTARAESGYRLYVGEDLARLDLILALRDADVGLEDIRAILARKRSLGEVLKLRLQALEAEILARRRVAAALRAALRTAEPTHQDLRRLWTVTKLSQTEFRAAVARFYDQVADGARMDDDWRRQMIDAGTPPLPDDPTPTQVDAWTELMGILSDKDYIAEVRANMARMWNDQFDPAAYAAASEATFARVRAAIAKGLLPASSEGAAIARFWLESSARAMKAEPDHAFLDWQLEQYRKLQSRSIRYQELMAILQGGQPATAAGEEWRWIVQAMEHHLRSDAAAV